MKKKNVIGHMTASKQFSKGWFRKLELLPRFICLLLAVVIWLCVAALVDSGKEDVGKNQEVPVTVYTEQ